MNTTKKIISILMCLLMIFGMVSVSASAAVRPPAVLIANFTNPALSDVKPGDEVLSKDTYGTYGNFVIESVGYVFEDNPVTVFGEGAHTVNIVVSYTSGPITETFNASVNGNAAIVQIFESGHPLFGKAVVSVEIMVEYTKIDTVSVNVRAPAISEYPDYNVEIADDAPYRVSDTGVAVSWFYGAINGEVLSPSATFNRYNTYTIGIRLTPDDGYVFENVEATVNGDIAQITSAGEDLLVIYDFGRAVCPGHIYDSDADTECNMCGEERTVEHDYVDGICTICHDIEYVTVNRTYTVYISDASEGDLVEFTPVEAGKYFIVSDNGDDDSIDPYIAVYDSEDNEISSADDNFDVGYNFYCTFEAMAGETYYFDIKAYSGNVSYDFTVGYYSEISHQPTAEESYVSLTWDADADYQWYFASAPEITDITDKNAAGHVFGSESDPVAVYEEDFGWKGVEYTGTDLMCYFDVELEAGQEMTLKLDSPAVSLSVDSDFGNIESWNDLESGETVTFVAERDASYYVLAECSADAYLNATIDSSVYDAVVGETESEITTAETGIYYCVVTLEDGRTLRTNSFFAENVCSHTYYNDCDESCNLCGGIRIVAGHNYVENICTDCKDIDAVVAEKTYTVYISGEGFDMVTFTPSVSGKYIISSDNGGYNDIDPYVDIYDSEDNTIATNDDGISCGYNFCCVFDATAGETYNIRLEVYDVSDTVEYDFRINKYIEIAHQPTTDEPYVNLTWDVMGDYQWYSVEAGTVLVSDMHAIGRTADTNERATYVEGKGWKGVPYTDTNEYNFFYIELKKGQKIELKADKDTDELGIWGYDEGSSCIWYDTKADDVFEFVADADDTYFVYAYCESDTYINAYTDDYAYTIVEGATENELNKHALSAGTYRCLVTLADGRLIRSDVVEYAGSSHNMSAVAAVAPTCTTEGKIAHYKCTECDYISSDEAGNNPLTTIIVAATGHKDENSDGKCDVCSAATGTAKPVTTVPSQSIKPNAPTTTGKEQLVVKVKKPAKVKIKKPVSSKKKQIVVTWKALKNVNGYQLAYSTSKKFTKKTTKTKLIKKAKTTKTTIKKLKSGKKYFIRIRAYKTVDGKKLYGAYSKVMNVKVK